MDNLDLFKPLENRDFGEITDPEKKVMYETYTVKSGDTLYMIAEKYGTSADMLIDINNLSTSIIYPNQVLLIPQYTDKGLMYTEYLTKDGDTLGSISNQYLISPQWIAKYNDISKLVLSPNQMIKIPKTMNKEYVILPEDNLEIILQKTGLNLSELILLNKGSWLKVGDKIIIG